MSVATIIPPPFALDNIPIPKKRRQPESSETPPLKKTAGTVRKTAAVSSKSATLAKSLTPSKPVASLKAAAVIPSKSVAQTRAVAQSKADIPAKAVAQSKAVIPAKAVAQFKAVTPAKTVAQSKAVIPAKAVAQSKAVTPAKTVAQSKAVTPAKTVAQSKAVTPAKAVAQSKAINPTKAVAKAVAHQSKAAATTQLKTTVPLTTATVNNKSPASPVNRTPQKPRRLKVAALRSLIGQNIRLPAKSAKADCSKGVIKPKTRRIAGVPQPSQVLPGLKLPKLPIINNKRAPATAPPSGVRKPIIYNELDEADDSDLDFIDDDDDTVNNWMSQLRAVTGYDPSRFSGMAGEATESSFAEVRREEIRSARIAHKEDAEEQLKLLKKPRLPNN